MKAKEVIKLIQKDGWFFERQVGSHKIFKHPSKKGIVVVPGTWEGRYKNWYS